MFDFIYKLIGANVGELVLKLKMKSVPLFYLVQGLLTGANLYLLNEDVLFLEDNVEVIISSVLMAVMSVLSPDTTVAEEERAIRKRSIIARLRKDENSTTDTQVVDSTVSNVASESTATTTTEESVSASDIEVTPEAVEPEAVEPEIVETDTEVTYTAQEEDEEETVEEFITEHEDELVDDYEQFSLEELQEELYEVTGESDKPDYSILFLAAICVLGIIVYNLLKL